PLARSAIAAAPEPRRNHTPVPLHAVQRVPGSLDWPGLPVAAANTQFSHPPPPSLVRGTNFRTGFARQPRRIGLSARLRQTSDYGHASTRRDPAANRGLTKVQSIGFRSRSQSSHASGSDVQGLPGRYRLGDVAAPARTYGLHWAIPASGDKL